MAARNDNQEIINCLLEYGKIDFGDFCLNECRKLTQITIPSYVTSIGNFAFEGFLSLKQIAIPPEVT